MSYNAGKTERPVTIEKGTNYSVGRNKNKIQKAIDLILADKTRVGDTRVWGWQNRQKNSQNCKGKYMWVLTGIFVKIPRKILLIFLCKWKAFYYGLFYPITRTHINFIEKRYLIDESENLDAVANAYRRLFPDKVQANIHEADLICEHIFDFLGQCLIHQDP